GPIGQISTSPFRRRSATICRVGKGAKRRARRLPSASTASGIETVGTRLRRFAHPTARREPGRNKILIPARRTSATMLASSLDEGAPTGGDQFAERVRPRRSGRDPALIRSCFGRTEVARNRIGGRGAAAASVEAPAGVTWPAGPAVPCPGRRPQVARRHYDRLWVLPTVKAMHAASPGERKREAGRSHWRALGERPHTYLLVLVERPPPLRLRAKETRGGGETREPSPGA